MRRLRYCPKKTGAKATLTFDFIKPITDTVNYEHITLKMHCMPLLSFPKCYRLGLLSYLPLLCSLFLHDKEFVPAVCLPFSGLSCCCIVHSLWDDMKFHVVSQEGQSLNYKYSLWLVCFCTCKLFSSIGFNLRSSALPLWYD